jgi:hypothetical protein
VEYLVNGKEILSSKKLNTEEASLQTLVDRDINRKENGFVIKYGTACINWDQNPLYSFFLFFFWSK